VLADICRRSLIPWRRLPFARRRRADDAGGRALRLGTAPLLLLIGGVLVAGLAGCGSSKVEHTAGGATVTETGAQAKYAGTAVSPPKPEPPLSLKDSLGHEVSLSDYQGKAVLVTFIYTHCPDTCPLIVSHLRVAQSQLGAQANDLQIVAVSTDPRGDTPSAVNKFLREHRMTGRMQYLIGSKAQLKPAWKAWSIQAKPAPGPKDRVGHSAIVYGISASGEVTTIYPGNFSPSQIVHDVPLLAAE
jgi:protein SCO1